MKIAAKQYIGTHDFAAFKTQGSSVKGTIRTIFDVKVEKEKNIIKISVSGDGFLYNMVRIIVGTLINVARGKTDATSILEIINKKDRSLAVRTTIWFIFKRSLLLKIFNKNVDTPVCVYYNLFCLLE